MRYDVYIFSRGEKIRYFIQGYGLSMFVLYLFYQNLWISLILSFPAALIFMKSSNKQCLRRQKLALEHQFKDIMEGLVSSLQAGYSMENAIFSVRKDLSLVYHEEDIIMKELQWMIGKLQVNVPVGDLFVNLGMRSGSEDILLFAQVMEIAKKSGGNLVKIMHQTGQSIGGKMDTRREIETMITGKKLEAKCMMGVPLGILLYLSLCTKGFLDPLYHNIFGMFIMSVALIVYVFCVMWIRRIMNIDF